MELELVHVIDGNEHLFGQIGAVAGDEQGRVFVLDTQTLEIAVIDPVGNVAEKYGRQGSAPGEFLALQRTIGFTGEAIITSDWRSGRVTHFDLTGTVLATFDWRAGGFGTQVPSLLFVGGSMVYGVSRAGQALQPTNWESPPSAVPAPQFRYVRLDSAGSPTPLGLPEDLSPMPWPPGADCGTSNGVIHLLNHAFTSGGPLVAFTPTGVAAVARRDSWTIDLMDTAGITQGEIRREVAPVAVTDEVWEAQPEIQEARAIEREFGELSGPGGTPCPVLEDRPMVQPPIRTLIADESGRLWVESMSPGGFTLTVLGTEGQILGESPMPDRDRRVTPYVRGDRLYVVIRNDLDVQSIAVYEAQLAN